MRPFTHHSHAVACCGKTHSAQKREDIECRSVLFEELSSGRSGREHTSRDNLKSSSKDSKSQAGRGSACGAAQRSAKSSTSATEEPTNRLDAADAVFLRDALHTSHAVTVGDDVTDSSSAANGPAMEQLQSTLMTLTARKLPSGPLPKMDEVLARFMNISPKQWQLLNTTIDELNDRFKQGALQWLLLRWLVAAHPEQFFPPPFNSYQQLLQQVSQKDTQVNEANNNAAKWRDMCARLEGERRTWKRQLQQMEKEVSGLYSALAERLELFPPKEAHSQQQEPQQRSDPSACVTAALPAVRKEVVVDKSQQQQQCQSRHVEQAEERQPQQQQCQSRHVEQAEERQPQQLQPCEQICQQRSQTPQTQAVYQSDKQPAALLLRQLVHPVSSAQDACPSEAAVGLDVQNEEEKKDAGPSDLSRTTTITRTKTTVITTESKGTSSHSGCNAKECDLADDTLIEAGDFHLRDTPTGKSPGTPRTVVGVCDKVRTADEATLISILGCVQNLLRRITADGMDRTVHSPSSPSSLQADQGGKIGSVATSNKRQLCKRHGKKVHRKNLELWYLQYQQQSCPPAAKDEVERKKLLHTGQDELGADKGENNEGHKTAPVTCNLRAPAEEMNKEKQKELRPKPNAVEQKCADNVALLHAQSHPEPAGEAPVEAHLINPRTEGLEPKGQRVYVPPCAPYMQANSPVPYLSVASTETTHAPHASMSETSSPPYALFQASQDNSPVKSYLRRFMALYKGGQHIPEVVAIRIFTENLKPALKQYVRSRHPTSLAHAILLARQAESYCAAQGVPLSSEREHTENSSARAPCREWAAANLKEECATERGGEVSEKKMRGHSLKQQLNACPPGGTSACIKPQCITAGRYQRRSPLPNKKAATSRHEAGEQWQVHLREAQDAQQLQPQQLTHMHQQPQEQLLHNSELLEEEVWHSGEDTTHTPGTACVMQTTRKEFQQQSYDEKEHHQTVMEPGETIVVIPRSGSKVESTEHTHVVGRVFRGQQPRYSAA